jgi:hypothetical protein
MNNVEIACKKSLQKVISSAINISFLTTGIEVNRGQKIAYDFLTKNTMVAITIWNIIDENNVFKINNKKKNFPDFSSALVMVRSLFEGYINMYYLLIAPETEEEKEFRLNMWDRHGLLERQRMANYIGSDDKKLEYENEKIDEYNKKIFESSYFKEMSKPDKQGYKNTNNWTRKSALDRADIANIDRSQSEFIYKFLSNYSHSESYALMQINSVVNHKTAEDLVDNLPIRFTEMFLSLTINIYSKMFSKISDYINEEKHLMNIIKQWNELKSKDLKKINIGND